LKATAGHPAVAIFLSINLTGETKRALFPAIGGSCRVSHIFRDNPFIQSCNGAASTPTRICGMRWLSFDTGWKDSIRP
jgi:hypothetical protein